MCASRCLIHGIVKLIAELISDQDKVMLDLTNHDLLPNLVRNRYGVCG